MYTIMMLPTLVSAFMFGSLVGGYVFFCTKARIRRNQARVSVGALSGLEALSISLECRGISARIIKRAIEQSMRNSLSHSSFVQCRSRPFRDFDQIVMKAGLKGVLSPSGARWVQIELMLLATFMGSLIGLFFSSLLGVILAIGGAIWGWSALRRALKEEMQARSFVAEKQLSHLIEVVSLGLRSGMSFDKSLELYHESFTDSLSRSLSLMQSQWSHGLIERSEGLRSVAQSYSSPLFDRLAESIIRSLRFGTSLTENLGIIANEARAIRKAKLEEKVIKAPVKMLLPVGTLILPAMLILILGPIMLDLMEGF